LAFGGATPDFLIVTALVAAVFFQPIVAAVLGFVAGLLHGGVTGSDTANFAISRTLVCYAAGYVSRLELEVRPWYVGLTVAAGTVLAYFLMMIPAPPPHVWPYVRDTIFSAMYNGVLAIPLYALLRRSLHPKVN
jgi:rod shape-determining protein MreD